MARTVFVTGANRGIGFAFVTQFLERGDRVYAGCRAPETATALQECQAQHGNRLTGCAA